MHRRKSVPAFTFLSMKRYVKATVVIVAMAMVLTFFFAPVVYWFGIGPGYATPHPTFVPVYRSASCTVFGTNWGLGVMYSRFFSDNGYAFGLVWGCDEPLPLPL